MKPHPHQLAALEYCRTRPRCVVQMPPGAGKSYVLTRLAAELKAAGGPVYAACPSEHTLRQLRIESLKQGLCPVLDKAEHVASLSARLTIGTFQTMVRRKSNYQTGGTLLADECHHINYKAPEYLHFAQRFDRVIGFSATPWSEGCFEFFECNKFEYGLLESIRNKTNAEFVIREWSQPTIGMYQLVFTFTCADAKSLSEKLPFASYAIYDYASANMQIQRFRGGRIGTLFVHRMLGEGFDLPQCKRLWIGRETDSPIAAMQMLGRALRPVGQRVAEVWVQHERTRKALSSAIKLAG